MGAGMKGGDGIDLKLLTLTSVFGVLGTAIVILFITVVYFQQENKLKQSDRFTVPPTALLQLSDAQRAKLASYRVLDAEKGRYSLPIDQAMDIVIEELASGTDQKAADDEPKEKTEAARQDGP